MNEQIWWFLARSSGIVAWALLTASVLWGIVLSTDLFPRNRRPAWLLDLHRWLGGLTCGFLALHLVTLWADSYIEFTIADFLIPFTPRGSRRQSHSGLSQPGCWSSSKRHRSPANG